MNKHPETQTLRACCSKVEPKIFAPPQTPFPEARWPKFNQLEMVTTFTYRPTDQVWWKSMHAILSYRGNRPTNSHTHKQTHRQGRLQYSAPLILARSVMMPLPGIPIHDLNWMRERLCPVCFCWLCQKRHLARKTLCRNPLLRKGEFG